MATKKKVLLSHNRAPGDTLVLTGLVRDIALTHGDQFEIGVSTSAMDFWRHNPYVANWSKAQRTRNVDQFDISYGKGLREQNTETIHFMPYFHRVFNQKYDVNVTPQLPYPDVHLSPEEDTPPIEGRYWIILSGGKSDFTAKVWEARKFQMVADRCRDWGIPVVQCGGTDTGHWHPELNGVLNLVGHTNLRDMIRLVKYADGVLCGVTMAMHLAAAVQTACVCLAGGREAWWWEAYVRENKGLICPEKLAVPHRFLHTIGLLECCRLRGCWRNKVVSINKDKSVCKKTVSTPGQTVPLCMNMITVDMVFNAMLSYYYDGTLTPIPGTRLEDEIRKVQDEPQLIH